ncbi:MAG: hypothetical protein HYY81_10425 [Deltaproteobacteria bacterium]|nr:hypothetical protein [Deltaproteobacteria bacterium]
MLNQDYKEMLSAFNDEKVDYMIVGAYAVAAHGVGVEFADAWNQRVELEVEGIRVNVIGRSHLIANKKAVGRPQDLADVARLEGEKP